MTRVSTRHLFPARSVDKVRVKHPRALFFILTLLASRLSLAECGGDAPLLNEPLGDVQTLFFDQNWALAIRPGSTVMTEAKARLYLDGTLGAAHLDMTYSKPGYVGIPFTFQKVLLSWTDETGTAQFSLLDWTQSCVSPGKTLWMNQAWSVDIALPNVGRELHGLNLKIWGSEN